MIAVIAYLAFFALGALITRLALEAIRAIVRHREDRAGLLARFEEAPSLTKDACYDEWKWLRDVNDAHRLIGVQDLSWDGQRPPLEVRVPRSRMASGEALRFLPGETWEARCDRLGRPVIQVMSGEVIRS